MAVEEMQVLSEKKARLNTWMKWFSGCGIGCMGLLALILGTLWYIKHDRDTILQQELEPYIAQGYPLMRQDSIEITAPLAGKHLLNGDMVVLSADCPDGVVIYANSCRIDTTVTGPILFKGNRLELGEKAVLAELSGDVFEFVNHGKISKNNLVIHKKP